MSILADLIFYHTDLRPHHNILKIKTLYEYLLILKKSNILDITWTVIECWTVLFSSCDRGLHRLLFISQITLLTCS